MSKIYQKPQSIKFGVSLLSILTGVGLAIPVTAARLETEMNSLLEQVSAEGAMTHLQAFQKVADESNGTRAAGTPGYALSAHYVAQQLLQAGYKVQYLPFDFVKFKKLGAAKLNLTAPTSVSYVEDEDFQVMAFSPSGDVTAQVTAVDIQLGEGNQSTSGCEAEDFAGFSAGNLALIQRGTCPFMQKAQLAQAAGAVGVIIFNQGETEAKQGLFGGTLSAEAKVSVPVYSVSYLFAVELLKLEDPVLSMQVETHVEEGKTFNVIAESITGDANNVVMLGAHLDGVEEGPGINDNGSGSAAILEVALKMRNVKTNNRLRFAWWGAEELGLVGSTRYVESLSDEERAKIALYLNFDMVASTNYSLGVFDGDGSKFGTRGPEGSASVEQLLQNFFALQGTQSVDTEISNRSDYAAFAAAGIPFGGTFTGAEGTKTEEEAMIYGGEAGKAYDSCYHSACDTLDNISQEALELNADAIAFVALTYGHSTASVKAIASSETGIRLARARRGVDLSHLPMHIHGVGDVSLK